MERNPRLRGTVKSFDDSAARKISGVKKVFKIRMGGQTYRRCRCRGLTWAAMQGKKVLKVNDDSGFEHLDTQKFSGDRKKP